MKSHFLIFVTGLLAGVFLMVAADPRTDHSASTAVSTEEAEQPQDNPTQFDLRPKESSELLNTVDPSNTTNNGVTQLRPVYHGEIRLPSSYKELIGPTQIRTPTFSERHERFASEPRDESWAFAMETGLTDYFTAHEGLSGIVFDSIECREKTCEIAGYAVEGHQGDTGQIISVVQQPWWQGGFAASSLSFDMNGNEYFVKIIYHGERYSE